MEMSSVHSLKTFVNSRLSAAVEEIIGAFENTLSVYEEELVRQRRLLDSLLKPEIKLHRICVSQPSIGKEAVLLRPKQCHQERSTSVDQDVPKPLMIKEEQKELCISQEDKHFELETEDLKLSPTCEKSESGEEQLLLLDLDQTRSATEQEPLSILSERWMPCEADTESSRVIKLHGDRSQDVITVGERYECTVCGESFSVCTDLNLHTRMHADEKRYRCKFCKKEFSSSSSVSRHLRVHTGEKPYECGLCGKRFNVNTTLKVHYRTHTGEKPYKCKTCGRGFTTSSNLKKHAPLHTKAACPRMRNVIDSHSEVV